MQPQLPNYKGQNLTQFPLSLRENTHITNLNLDNNKISSIPDWISEFNNLKVIYLNENQISDIEVLTTLSNLEVLHLNANQINFIPESIADLKHLKRLFINGNNISRLPDAICNLPQLRALLVANNKLTSIPSGIGQLKHLETLNLFDNSITSIPKSIGDLGCINYLQLSQNEISELPESIGNIQSVTSLEIFSNELTTLPPQLSRLKNLKNLNIGDNNITRIENIPVGIQRLSIYANPVDYIDPYIPGSFKASSGEYQPDYIFADNMQVDVLKLEKHKLGSKLKIVDLPERKIHWFDQKHIPQELITKWELNISRDNGKVE
jgi:Leucine-rich repeat (LRR) protein